MNSGDKLRKGGLRLLKLAVMEEFCGWDTFLENVEGSGASIGALAEEAGGCGTLDAARLIVCRYV